MRARTSSGRSVIPEIYDEPRRRRQRQHVEVDLLLEAYGPREHSFEVAGADDLANDRRSRHAPRALVDEVAFARVQVEARRGLHAHDDKGRAGDRHRVAAAVLLQRRLHVLNAVARQALTAELEDDAVVALVATDADALEQRRRGSGRRADADARRSAVERVDALGGRDRRGG